MTGMLRKLYGGPFHGEEVSVTEDRDVVKYTIVIHHDWEHGTSKRTEAYYMRTFASKRDELKEYPTYVHVPDSTYTGPPLYGNEDMSFIGGPLDGELVSMPWNQWEWKTVESQKWEYEYNPSPYLTMYGNHPAISQKTISLKMPQTFTYQRAHSTSGIWLPALALV